MAVKKYRAKKIISKLLFGILVLVIVIPILFPLYFVLISSFKNMAQVYIMPPKLFGFKPILDNYIYIFKTQHYGTYMMNSTIVAVASTALSLLLGVPAAYAIARYKMGKANTAILTARLLPNISILLPYYFIFSKLRMIEYLRCADSQPHGAVPSADCVDYGGIFQ
ncbi:MAG: carbohydrate ABC transporter permease [Enterocloster sp.]